jgi:hypothetical protein
MDLFGISDRLSRSKMAADTAARSTHTLEDVLDHLSRKSRETCDLSRRHCVGIMRDFLLAEARDGECDLICVGKG